MKTLYGASPGCGGATLVSSTLNGQKVILKIFPTDSPYRYIRGRRKSNPQIRDYGQFEPGTGLLLTDLFLRNEITQNITRCHRMEIVPYAYQTPISVCTKEPIPNQEEYLLSQNLGVEHPLSSLAQAYYSPFFSGEMEQPQLGDLVRILIAEKCQGDMLGLIQNLSEFPQLDQLLNYMVFMVCHTLLILDAYLEGYSHNDLGLRNILYTITLFKPESYFRYRFPLRKKIVEVDIPASMPIPKLWDFAFVAFGSAERYPEYYSYLNQVPSLQIIEGTNRNNDLYVLLNDIREQLALVGVFNSRYSLLDLSRIKESKSNTQAVYEYLKQMPLEKEMMASPEHQILQKFPPDSVSFESFSGELF